MVDQEGIDIEIGKKILAVVIKEVVGIFFGRSRDIGFFTVRKSTDVGDSLFQAG